MSMPVLPPPNPELTREQALNMILSSIALEEAALSQIINAESDKIQYVLDRTMAPGGNGDMQQVLAVNKSVSSLLEVVMQNQMLLKGKMERVLEHLAPIDPRPGPPVPPVPPIPPIPPIPPDPLPCPSIECECTFPRACQPACGGSSACFAAIPCTCYCGSALLWEPLQENPVVGIYKNNPAKISLPATNCLTVSFVAQLCLMKPVQEAVVVEVQVLCGEKLITSKSVYSEGCDKNRTVACSAIIAVPCSRGRCYVSVFLRAPGHAQVQEGSLRFCW